MARNSSLSYCAPLTECRGTAPLEIRWRSVRDPVHLMSPPGGGDVSATAVQGARRCSRTRGARTSELLLRENTRMTGGESPIFHSSWCASRRPSRHRATFGSHARAEVLAACASAFRGADRAPCRRLRGTATLGDDLHRKIATLLDRTRGRRTESRALASAHPTVAVRPDARHGTFDTSPGAGSFSASIAFVSGARG